ncbi:MAG: 23S rRNA (uridine(2552)-2'-O)-methyltransferase RlmE [Gammaproteobacteria bacterium]|nr:23S rRNA (uridine(2552)-2'-O)-methyltransferase RlmE [Gammaproteobacteria bacterium]MBT8134656.1 23S rRNA (uridine(2552)-2'-O)-methyltransferase RlmE [Gammaproteobacteria bacterium]NNJ48724.1 23S rRNA (uridine(2552)-2'-O)-methyltransferase RlmE [Gammaproteobacteria bacterium]
MAKSKSSKGWLKEHFDDEYVRRSQQDGYRSRAIYKLIEIDKKDRLIKPGMTIIDLGAAPGGWSEYCVKKLGKNGTVVALDILPMEPIEDVTIIQGDFREDAVFEELMAVMNNERADLVISDMAPNISGMESVDMPRAYYLCELALDLARQVLKPGGGLLVKLFQGEGFEAYNKELKASFSKVVMRKPKASRARSREIYALATGFLGNEL